MQKTTTIDAPSAIEKIIIATNAINWMTVRMNGVLNQFKSIPESERTTIAVGIITRGDHILEQAFENLRAIAENIGNYVDGQDMLDEIDSAYTEPAFDIMYDRPIGNK